MPLRRTRRRCGRDDGVGQLPDPADGVLEGAVPVDQDLDPAPGEAKDFLLEAARKGSRIAREKLDGPLLRVVGPQKPELGIVSALTTAIRGSQAALLGAAVYALIHLGWAPSTERLAERTGD